MIGRGMLFHFLSLKTLPWLGLRDIPYGLRVSFSCLQIILKRYSSVSQN